MTGLFAFFSALAFTLLKLCEDIFCNCSCTCNSKFESAKFGTKPPEAPIFLAPEGRPIDLTMSLLKTAEPFP